VSPRTRPLVLAAIIGSSLPERQDAGAGAGRGSRPLASGNGERQVYDSVPASASPRVSLLGRRLGPRTRRSSGPAAWPGGRYRVVFGSAGGAPASGLAGRPAGDLLLVEPSPVFSATSLSEPWTIRSAQVGDAFLRSPPAGVAYLVRQLACRSAQGLTLWSPWPGRRGACAHR